MNAAETVAASVANWGAGQEGAAVSKRSHLDREVDEHREQGYVFQDAKNDSNREYWKSSTLK